MKKLLLLLLLIPLVSCLEKKSCGKIVQKYIDNGKYYFAMRAIGSGGLLEMEIQQGLMFLGMLKSVKKLMNYLMLMMTIV
jgi:hypothetical protein